MSALGEGVGVKGGGRIGQLIGGGLAESLAADWPMGAMADAGTCTPIGTGGRTALAASRG